MSNNKMFNLYQPQIFESLLIPEEKEITERIEWITRVKGKIKINHDLRHRGSIYRTRTIPRQAFILPGNRIVMHPNDAALIQISTVI